MKYIFILLCTTMFISCSSNKTSDASTTDSKSSTPIEPLSNNKAEMTDQEKAQIAEQLLAFSSKELEDLKSDDCGTLTKSLHLLYARQTLAEKYQLNADDVNQLIGILESKVKANCGNGGSPNPDITFGVKTEGGQVAFSIKIPTDAAIWAVLTPDQRELVLASVPEYTKTQLIEMENRYSPYINKIREVPTVIKVRPTAYVRPDIQTPVLVNEKPDAKSQVIMDKNRIDQTKFKRAEVKQ